ncbi:MAG: glycosyltransferase family 39 protein [Bacteroidia bacterium]|nr:glycosyltransferase family 39 protein [Bacteroidia bacterium]
MGIDIFKKVLRYFQEHVSLLVIIIFVIVEFLINPIGEFCLNDDWAYAKAVKTYLETSELKFSFWQAIPGLPLVFTGIFFSKLFGFSFTLLRLISVGCVIISTLLIDSNLKRLAVSKTNRLLVLMLFVFNPLTISLGNSFMPDVFQMFLGIVCFHFMILYLGNRSVLHFLLFIVFSVLLCLNRQTGVLIPIVFAIIFLIIEKRNVKNLGLAVLPFVITYAVLFIFEYSAKSILPQNYNLQLNNILATLLHPNLSSVKTIGYYFITSTVCLGLFILPFTISSLKENYELLKRSLLSKIIFVGYFSLISIKLFYSGNVFPFVGNMFYHLGVGPVILTGFNTDENQVLPFFTTCIWACLNFVGGLSFFISLQSIIKKQQDSVQINSSKLFFPDTFCVVFVAIVF